MDTKLLEFGPRGGIELGSLSSELHVDGINVTHQLQSLIVSDILVERTAEIVGNVVFSVGKCACAAETGHNGAALAADAAFDFVPVDRAAAPVQRMAGLKYGHLQLRAVLHQLVCGKNTAGARANDYNVIIHMLASPVFCRSDTACIRKSSYNIIHGFPSNSREK